ncbi:MAG: hypothetical protein AAF533_10400 [Acidobacteriota bacterium]
MKIFVAIAIASLFVVLVTPLGRWLGFYHPPRSGAKWPATWYGRPTWRFHLACVLFLGTQAAAALVDGRWALALLFGLFTLPGVGLAVREARSTAALTEGGPT